MPTIDLDPSRPIGGQLVDGAEHVLPDGVFTVDNIIAVTQRRDITLRSAGQFVATTEGASQRPRLAIDGSTNVHISGVKLDGPNRRQNPRYPGFAAYDARKVTGHGVAIRRGSTGVTVEDVEVCEVYGDALYVGQSSTADGPCRDVTVRRFTGLRSGRHGVGLVNVEGVVLEDVLVDWCGYAGVDIEPIAGRERVLDATLRRLRVGSRVYPLTITATGRGGAWGEQIQRVTVDQWDTLRCPSNHTAVLTRRGPYRDLTITGLRDTRQPTKTGMNLAGEWRGTVRIADCVVRGRGGVFARINARDRVELAGNDTTGFDRQLTLVQPPPAAVVVG